MGVFARVTALGLFGLLLFPAAARAAEGVVGQADLDRAVSERLSSEAAERQLVKDILARDVVRKTASDMGVDLSQASAAVDTLSGAELAQLASQASAVEQALAGGDTTIQISLVVLLLLIIILILLVK
jgi:hypothetical protein